MDARRRGFLEALEQMFERSNKSESRNDSEVVVTGVDGRHLLVSRNEFRMNDVGVEIADEFIIGWDGISRIDASRSSIKIGLTDSTVVEVSSCP